MILAQVLRMPAWDQSELRAMACTMCYECVNLRLMRVFKFANLILAIRRLTMREGGGSPCSYVSSTFEKSKILLMVRTENALFVYQGKTQLVLSVKN